MNGPGSELEVQLGFGCVLYGGSECLKGINVSKMKSCETSEQSEEVELEVDEFKLEGEEVKLRWANEKGNRMS
jgi:hypothetical protein